MITDQLQDSPRERSAPARELKRMKFSEASEDFDNIVLQNQQLIMAATEAAKSAAHTVNQLSEILKAVLPAIVPQAGRVDPDPTPVGRPPPAPPPSTSPFQPGDREPKRSDQMPEKLSKIMERSANNFCKQLRHMHRAKERLEQAMETVKFLKENPLRYPSGCRPFSSCVTWSELDETWQRASEADYTWHITFAKGSTKREVMSQMHHAFTTFQEIEAHAQEASYKKLSIRATRGAYDSVMRSSIEEFIKSEDIDINGDRPMSGVPNQMIDQFSDDLYKKAYDRVVKEIVDKRERIAKHLKDEAKTKEELSKRQPEQLLEQYVSSCVKKIVTTTSVTDEEVKAEKNVVSALKNVPKGKQKGDPKNVTSPGGAQGKGKGVLQTKKGKGKGKGKPKNKSKGKGQGTSANKSQTKGSGKGKKKSSKGQGSGKEKKGGKTGGKTGGKSKGQKPSKTR